MTIAPHDSLADAREEAKSFAGKSLRDHYEAFVAVCAFADAVAASTGLRDEPDPVPEAYLQHIEALKLRYRKRK